MTKLRVIHVTYSLDIGGAEMVVLDIVSRLDRSRFEPSTLSYQRGGELKARFLERDVPVHEVEKREGKDWRLMFKLLSFFRRERPDIVHFHNSPMWIYGALPARLAGARGIFVTEHSSRPHPSRAYVAAARVLEMFTDLITTNSQQIKDALIRDLRLSPDRIQIINNGLDASSYHGRPAAAATRLSLGVEPNAPVIGIVARLEPIKDHATLLKAMALVLQAQPNVRLIVVGAGSLSDSLKQAARALRIDDSALFLGSRNDVQDLLSAVDVFVLCSLKEGQSMAIMEAMACGLPVVATATGGTPELVLDGETGLLVPPAQPEVLARALLRLLDNKDEAHRLGRAGRQRIVTHYDIHAIIDRYQQAYLESTRTTH